MYYCNVVVSLSWVLYSPQSSSSLFHPTMRYTCWAYERYLESCICISWRYLCKTRVHLRDALLVVMNAHSSLSTRMWADLVLCFFLSISQHTMSHIITTHHHHTSSPRQSCQYRHSGWLGFKGIQKYSSEQPSPVIWIHCYAGCDYCFCACEDGYVTASLGVYHHGSHVSDGKWTVRVHYDSKENSVMIII